MAHPVRPDSYIEISNFYTVTIYNKGAEVIRMLHTLLGNDGFQAGMKLYFERHDGQAVTTDDFVAAMSDASGKDLSQFRLWYQQAGTPTVRVSEQFDPVRAEYVLRFEQECPPTPGQPTKQPMHIPIRLGLLDASGRDIPLPVADGATETVFELAEASGELRIEGVATKPVASVGRDFSAPIRFAFERPDEELAFLLAHDADEFNRWDAAQEYSTRLLLGLVDRSARGETLELPDAYSDALRTLLLDDDRDPAFVAETLTLPSESYLADRMAHIEIDAIHEARELVRRTLAFRHEDVFDYRYRELASDEPYRFDPASVGRRGLRNVSLGYLMELSDPDIRAACVHQAETSDNMTDSIAALAFLANCECPERETALAAFHDRWRGDNLVMDKWFAIQATSRLEGTIDTVKRLREHPAFDFSNPNRVRSLIGAFCHSNQVRFNEPTGAGYRFLADSVLELDPLNPQIAARLLGAASRWQRLDRTRRAQVQAELERILAVPGLSKDTYEIASKTLG